MVEAWLTYSFLFLALYFEVFMLVSFLQRRKKNSTAQKPARAEWPSVAIVVPCFNEETTLASTLNSLLALDYPQEKLEIIVVDDGSTDKTLEIAKTFESTLARQARKNFFGTPQAAAEDQPILEASKMGYAEKILTRLPRISVFHKENGGKHTAMNYGLERTDADLIGCLDADSIVAPNALKEIAPVFDDEKVAAVTPGILIKKPQTVLQYMQDAEYRLSIFNRYTLSALGSAFITPGPFSILRTKVVKEMNGWRHGHSTEDLEMALRIQNAGYLIGNAPKAVVHTGTPRNLRGLFRQRVRWTYGFLRNAMDYKHMFGSNEYGNLGLIILPSAIVSIGVAIYFFARIVYFGFQEILDAVVRTQILGIQSPSFDPFYINTSIMWFLIYIGVALVILLIALGTFIGTGKRNVPAGTPLFVIFYSFLVPLWLSAAVVRAVFKTGVRWR